MKLLIYGASGKTGHELVRLALSRGHKVTAFVRDPSKLKIADGKLTIFVGDVVNYRLVQSSVSGIDAVFCLLGPASPLKYDQSIVDGVENIIRAMKKQGIDRFIYLSFIGVRASRAFGCFVVRKITPWVLKAEIQGHEVREEMIKNSDLNWTVVRPPTLSNGKLTSKYRIGEEIRSHGFYDHVSRADVAECMLNLLNDDRFSRKFISILP